MLLRMPQHDIFFHAAAAADAADAAFDARR